MEASVVVKGIMRSLRQQPQVGIAFLRIISIVDCTDWAVNVVEL